MKRLSTILAFLLPALPAFAQGDTLFNRTLDEVIITATRTERKLSNVAVPVILVNQQAIRLSGSLRLNDILQEQTGLFVTSGTGSNAVGGGVFGNGVQLQGLSPDHTLILLDGEPLIGRQGGVMDLSRFAVGNIRKVEIVKGPSSSLYGSEAMGGVINIITAPGQGRQFQAGIRSGSFLNTDLYASGNEAWDKGSVYYFFNRNSSRGYELDKNTPEKTLDPYYNYTGHVKYTQRFGANTRMVLNVRSFYGHQDSRYAINSPSINVGGNGITEDVTVNPVFIRRFDNRWQTSLRLVGSYYRFAQQLDSLSNGKEYYADRFRQGFYRAENQTDFAWNENNTLTAGGGFTLQTVNTTRYRRVQDQQMWHAFAQHEWKGLHHLTVISGLRYDYNTDFAARLSPKLALQYTASEKWSFSGSYGAGFKAPDFRQLYLSFVNNAAEGYSIYGSSEFSLELLQRQQSLGLIAAILPAASQITTLQPEVSDGFNLGGRFTPAEKIRAEFNLFRNDVRNLINYIPVATNANGTSVFSYLNINRAYTQGGEFNLCIKPLPGITISAGYQYLETADKDLLRRVQNKEIYGRDEANGPARLMTRRDYSGLLNRSRHMANLRLFWEEKDSDWNGSLRLVYRSRFGVNDRDGNGFANMEEEFAPGLLQVNLTAGYRLTKSWQFQAGVNNLLNDVNPRFVPNLPGINWFLGVNYSFKK